MHWRQMESEKVWLHWQDSKDDEEDSWEWKRTCIQCVAKRDGLTEEEAKLKVLSKTMEHKLARGNQLKEAKELDREKIEAMDGASRSKVRGVLKSTMIELFGPLAKFILRKRAALELVRLDVLRHDELVRKLAQCEDIESEQDILLEMEALEVDDKYLAFADKGEEQHKYILAASFSDTWTEIRDASGRLIGGISSWYVCMAMTRWVDTNWKQVECCRLTPSKDWTRKLDDPLAPKNPYYCSCYARYNHSWGQVVQISRLNKQNGKLERMYVRSDVPSWDVEDIRAMYFEEELAPRSAMDLYNQMKRVEPCLNELIVKDDQGHCKVVDHATWAALPQFRWVEIFNMVGVDLVEKPKGKKNKKR